MTTDKHKLRALAEALLRDEQGLDLTKEEVKAFPMMVAEYESILLPSVVLSLLDEIAQLTKENARLREDRDGLLEAGAHLL